MIRIKSKRMAYAIAPKARPNPYVTTAAMPLMKKNGMIGIKAPTAVEIAAEIADFQWFGKRGFGLSEPGGGYYRWQSMRSISAQHSRGRGAVREGVDHGTGEFGNRRCKKARYPIGKTK